MQAAADLINELKQLLDDLHEMEEESRILKEQMRLPPVLENRHAPQDTTFFNGK